MSETGEPIVEVTVEDGSQTAEVTEVVEAVAEAISEVVEEVAEAVEEAGSESNDESMAYTLGTLVATVANIALRIDSIESKLEATSVQAEIATDIASIALTEVDEQATQAEPEIVISEIPEDEPPPTGRTKFGKWFFGE